MSEGIRRTSLTPYAATMRDADPAGARKLAAKQWHDSGTVIFLPDSIARMPWQDREIIERIAGRLYGVRGK